MHMFDRSVNFLGGHGIVGGQIPIGTGVGFAIKYRGGDQVCVCFMGEAAVNGGAFHESLNMAGLWKLPVVYVIENNRYGMGTAIERSSSIKDLFKRGESYNIADDQVDGQDVLAVRQVMARAVDRARRQQQPSLIEVHTYRYVGHSMSDAASGTYRTKAELEESEKRDPIALFRAHLGEAGELTDGEFDAMDTEVKAVIQDAWDFADNSPEPPVEALYENVVLETAPEEPAEV